jgi:hypothetical protein
MATTQIFDGQGNLTQTLTRTLTNNEINANIRAQLSVVDIKSIRALREGDQVRIDDLEAQAATLRAQLV